MISNDVLVKFWAKKMDSDVYPLLYHMIDTVAVTQELWDKSLHASARSIISRKIGVSDAEASKLVGFWAGLHDIGKASPGFQCQDETIRQELQKLGFTTSGKDVKHGIITAYLLRRYLANSLGKDFAYKIATTVGGHHGIFPRSIEVNDVQSDTELWQEAQRRLFEIFGQLCGVDSSSSINLKSSPGFFMFLAGLTSVADWIASNETFFPYKVGHYTQEHLSYARKQASLALDKLGWTGWKPPSAPFQIHLLFPFITDVRPLQQEAIAIASTLSAQPGLVIIEAPMGEGKTEAALYLADSWIAQAKQKGCYFALPTMATSDQMFSRVRDFLGRRYHDERLNLMLLHGHADLSAEFESLKSNQTAFNARDVYGEGGYDGAPSGLVASDWFTYRKRGLLAPFGVGTVDQVLLAVLQTRHFFVRLFGLANKTIIIDEIHAYDAYMITLLERLLEWLAAADSSVVMLSATLPKERRDALLEAYAKGLNKSKKDIPVEVGNVKYPRISWIVGNRYGAKSIATSPQSVKKLKLQWVDGSLRKDEEYLELGRELQEALSCGGCAAVICNTVDQSQKVYSALKPYFPENADDGGPELDLLHARYLFGDRKRRQERTLLRFGKPAGNVRCEDGIERPVNRPGRAVLVATQVIEQSLDLDFDLIITEMAPVDLLLQRAGRLHRHTRDRPEKLKEPALWICQPVMNEGIPDFGGGTEAVYDPHILLRSWLAIKDRMTQDSAIIKIPDEVEDLIEGVYRERECLRMLSREMQGKWDKSLEELKTKRRNYEDRARANRILPPGLDIESLLEALNKKLEEEESPEIHETMQALTRLSEEPSVSVICLSGVIENPRVSDKALDTKNCPDNDTTRKLLEHSVRISRRGLVQKIVKEGEPIPEEWHKRLQLRHHCLLFFDDKRTCSVGNYLLRLDGELGLTIHKKEVYDGYAEF